MLPRVALVCLLAASSGGVADAQRAQAASEQEQWILAEYWKVVRSYATEPAKAIKEMAAWPQDRIAKAQATQFQPDQTLTDLSRSKTEWTPSTLRAAAMLHTETGLEAFRRREGAQFQFHVGVADGWLSLADNRASKPGGLRSRWTVAVARVYLLNAEFGLAETHLSKASQQIDNDPAILLAYGTVKESQAALLTADSAGSPGTVRREASEILRERDALWTTAAALLERALAADGTLAEARLRLARLAMLRGDVAKAEQELLRLKQAAPPPASLYLVSLWLGQMKEKQKQLDPAARLYVEAVLAQPDAQSAYLALSQILHATGQREEAAGVMERWFSRGVKSTVADPWSLYPLGLDANLEARFASIFADAKR